MTLPDSFDEYKRRMEAEGYHIAMQPIQLTPGRFPLPKPYPDNWTIEQCIMQAAKEGHALLAAEEGKPAPSSVSSVKPDSKTAVQDALGKMSDNPYTRAQSQLLEKMPPKLRSVIEGMMRGDIPKDKRYDKFILNVATLGDKLSGTQ